MGAVIAALLSPLLLFQGVLLMPMSERAFTAILGAEGGYSNHPNDRGGRTMMGVTEGTLRRAVSLGIVPAKDVRELSRDEVRVIYDRLYWQPAKCDAMPERLAMAHFDAAINHGIGGAGIILQRALGALGHAVKVDGSIGPMTLEALENALDGVTEDEFLIVLLAKRLERYDEIVRHDPSQAVFLRGWNNRIRNLRRKLGV